MRRRRQKKIAPPRTSKPPTPPTTPPTIAPTLLFFEELLSLSFWPSLLPLLLLLLVVVLLMEPEVGAAFAEPEPEGAVVRVPIVDVADEGATESGASSLALFSAAVGSKVPPIWTSMLNSAIK